MRAGVKNAIGSNPAVLIRFLNGIVDREFQKSDDEINMTLVDECLAAITRLDSLVSPNQADSYSAFQAELCEKAVQDSYPLHPVLPGGSKFGIYTSPQKKNKITNRRLGRRFAAALIAAAIMTSLLTVGVIAKFAGFDFREWVEEILKLKPGESTELDGFTVFKGEDRERFNSIEEFLDKENLDILYPSVLPENVICKTVMVYKIEECFSYVFSLSDKETKNITYKVSEKHDKVNLSEYDILEIGDTVFYLKEFSKYYQSIFYYNGYQCIIEATDYTDIILIISNMKGC